jgi:hypothetical protein
MHSVLALKLGVTLCGGCSHQRWHQVTKQNRLWRQPQVTKQNFFWRQHFSVRIGPGFGGTFARLQLGLGSQLANQTLGTLHELGLAGGWCIKPITSYVRW